MLNSRELILSDIKFEVFVNEDDYYVFKTLSHPDFRFLEFVFDQKSRLKKLEFSNKAGVWEYKLSDASYKEAEDKVLELIKEFRNVNK